MALLFAATHPERTQALVLVDTFARRKHAESGALYSATEWSAPSVQSMVMTSSRSPRLSRLDLNDLDTWTKQALRQLAVIEEVAATRRLVRSHEVITKSEQADLAAMRRISYWPRTALATA